MIVFLIFYLIVYINFFIFSIIFIISSFFFFIFLFAYNLDSVIFFQFDFQSLIKNWKKITEIYIRLFLVFLKNYKKFLLGPDFDNYQNLITFSFRKFLILCILFTGYFYYFLLFILIFFFSVIFLLFIFSFLRPFIEELHKTIKIYSKRADQQIWNEKIYIFFHSFIKDQDLLNFSVKIFSQQGMVKLLEFVIYYFFDGLESFCKNPIWFYIFSDFILIFENLVFFYEGMFIFIE